LGARQASRGMPPSGAPERLPRLGRLLERLGHAPQWTIDTTAEAAEVTALLERPARRLELADGLVHASQEELPLGVVRLLLREPPEARDHHVGRVAARAPHR